MVSRGLWIAAAAFLLAPAPAFTGELPDSFTLGRYVPGDCFLYVHGTHNPEADFICAHWGRVFDAVKTSGVGGELKNLFVGNLSEPERADFESFWATATRLVHGVRWGDLIRREFVFAERFGGAMPVPDLLFLCRPDPKTLADNVTGLKAILEAVASRNEEVSLVEEKLHGADVWSISCVNVPLTLHLFRKGDVVGLAMQRPGLQDSLALLAGESSKPAVVDTARFKQALAEVPSPEDAVVFFDMKRMMEGLSKFPDMITAAACAPSAGAESTAGDQPPEKAMRVKRLLAKIIKQCDIMEYVISTTETRGLQQFEHSVSRMVPDYKDKALGRILMGPEPIKRFDRFIPVEATGFEVCSGINWAELYHTILDIIKDAGQEGQAALEQWAEFQKTIGFNLDEDLFSWLSGETVTVYLKPSVVSAFGGSSDWVTLIRTKDAKLAMEKVDAAIQRLDGLLAEHGQASLMISPAGKVRAEGFRNVTHPFVMMFLRLTVGVSDEWLILGSSESAVNKVLDTAAGKTKTIADNPRFQQEGIVPTGPVCSASFTDLSNLGNELGGAMAMMAFVSSFIPDEPEARPVKSILGALGRLTPAFQELNFFRSTSSASTFDGLTGRTERVTTYKPLAPTGPKSPEPNAEEKPLRKKQEGPVEQPKGG